MKKIAVCSFLAFASFVLFAASARASAEPPCGTICGCSTGCARGCTDGGRTITCGVYGDCHTICIHFSPASAGPSFLAAATQASPAAQPPAGTAPWTSVCASAAAPSAPAR
jgi:hypothetical protein